MIKKQEFFPRMENIYAVMQGYFQLPMIFRSYASLHCFVEVETYNRVIDNEFIAISAMNILPFAIFALAMIKTIYKKNRKTISNALPIVSMIIMLAFGTASYFIEDQSKHMP